MTATPILALAGPMKVGKSSVGGRVAHELRWARASFGDYVRREAERRRIANDRPALQRLGQELVAAPDQMVTAVLDSALSVAPRGLVLDGVRHRSVIGVLNGRPDIDLVLCFLDAPRKILLRRWIETGGNRASFIQAEMHPVEADLRFVREAADFVVDAAGPLDLVVSSVLEHLTRLLPIVDR